MERLLDRLIGEVGKIRRLRAIEALENANARAILTTLTEAMPHSTLGTQAREALERLTR